MTKQTIKLEDGRVVYKDDHITAKTKTLVEFGYGDLTEQDVREELNKVLNHNNDLTVIGFFIKDDIIVED